MVALAAVAGCGGEAEIEPVPPPIHDIAESWQAVPFAVSQDVLANARHGCGQMRLAPNAELVDVDARGASLVMLVFAGPNDERDCLVELARDGTPGAGAGSGTGGPFAPPSPGLVTVVSSGSGGSFGATRFSTVVGQAGSGVVRVEILTLGGRRLEASRGPTGWYAGWWPDDDGHAVVTGYDAMGVASGTAK